MHLWLKEIPQYGIAFSQCIIVSAMFGVFSSGFYTPLTAAGKLKGNSIAALFICGSQFVIAYILLKLGFDVMWVQYSYIVIAIIFSLIIKPYLLIREVGYKVSDFVVCYKKAVAIFFLSFASPFALSLFVDVNTIVGFLGVGFVSVFSVVVVSYMFLSKEIKLKLNTIIARKMKR